MSRSRCGNVNRTAIHPGEVHNNEDFENRSRINSKEVFFRINSKEVYTKKDCKKYGQIIHDRLNNGKREVRCRCLPFELKRNPDTNEISISRKVTPRNFLLHLIDEYFGNAGYRLESLCDNINQANGNSIPGFIGRIEDKERFKAAQLSEITRDIENIVDIQNEVENEAVHTDLSAHVSRMYTASENELDELDDETLSIACNFTTKYHYAFDNKEYCKLCNQKLKENYPLYTGKKFPDIYNELYKRTLSLLNKNKLKQKFIEKYAGLETDMFKTDVGLQAPQAPYFHPYIITPEGTPEYAGPKTDMFRIDSYSELPSIPIQLLDEE